MNTTTELPIADAMTAAELMASLRELTAMFSSKKAVATMVLGVNDDSYLSLRPNGYGTDYCHHTINGKSWPAVINEAGLWIATYKVTSRDATIRKMALAIIELTDEHTKCTAEMLKRREFSAEQIEEFHEAACQRASEMCSNAPFVVVF